MGGGRRGDPLDRTDEAITAAEEATAALRALSKAGVTDVGQLPALAISQQNLGKFLLDAERHHEGLPPPTRRWR